MNKILKLMLFVIAGLAFACNPAPDTHEDAQDSESTFLSLLMKDSDIAAYNCDWVSDFVNQTSGPNDFQSKGSDRSANRVLSGTCVRPDESPFHITLRHELYLYKTSQPNEIGSYIVSLSASADMRNFDLEVASNYESVSKCASYLKSKYQDCFFVSQYNQIVSVVWINSNRELRDTQLKTIAVDIVSSVEKRILSFMNIVVFH